MTTERPFEPWTQLKYYAEAGESLELEAFITAIGPSESFRALLRLEPEDRERVLTTLPAAGAAELIAEIPDAQAATFMGELEVSEAASIVSAMPSAEQANILADMRDDSAEAILSEMAPAIAADVRELIRYPSDVAGGLMATEFLSFEDTTTVGEIRHVLGEWVESHPQQEVHAYVVSPAQVLIGAID